MTKKYILKPGQHQFAPGSPAIHNNDNLSDEEAKWYLQRYPHIKKLFVTIPLEVTKARRPRIKHPKKDQTDLTIKQPDINNENLPATN